MPAKIEYEEGERIGHLIFIKRVENSLIGNAIFRCSCGKEIITRIAAAKNLHTRSCGCTRMTHGETTDGKQTSEYKSWAAMNSRCNDVNNISYKDYGQRGISVCQQWQKSYEQFLYDMGRKPSLKHSIDRIDVNGNYEPSNCRWATPREQANNRRVSITVNIEGISENVTFWAALFKVTIRTFRRKYKQEDSIENLYTKFGKSKAEVCLMCDEPVRCRGLCEKHINSYNHYRRRRRKNHDVSISQYAEGKR